MTDSAERARVVAAILEGEQDIQAGRVMDLGIAFDDIRTDLGLVISTSSEKPD
jgi:hypothetical protein